MWSRPGVEDDAEEYDVVIQALVRRKEVLRKSRPR